MSFAVVALTIDSENSVLVWIRRFFSYVPVYFFGAYCGLCKPDWILKANVKNWVKICFSMLSLIALGLYTAGFAESLYFRSATAIIFNVCVWFIYSPAMFDKVKTGFPLKISFFIYVMHILLLGIMDTIANKVFRLAFVVSICEARLEYMKHCLYNCRSWLRCMQHV